MDLTPTTSTIAPTVTIPVAIANAFPAQNAVLESVLDMAESNSPVPGAEKCTDDTPASELELGVDARFKRPDLTLRLGGAALVSDSAFLSTEFLCLARATSGMAKATLVPANYEKKIEETEKSIDSGNYRSKGYPR